MKYLILLMILISACTYDPGFLDDKPISGGLEEISDEDALDELQQNMEAPEEAAEETAETKDETPAPRVTERDVRLKFDFNLLTADNCNFYINSYKIDIAEFSDDLEDLNDDSIKKEGDAVNLLEELNSLDQSDPFWKRTKDDYDSVQQSIDSIQKRIRDGEKLEEDMEYTLDEMKEECIILKKRR